MKSKFLKYNFKIIYKRIVLYFRVFFFFFFYQERHLLKFLLE